VDVFLETLEILLMLVIPVDPKIGLLEPQLLGGALQSDVQAQESDRGPYLVDFAREPSRPCGLLRKQAREGVHRPGIADDHRRAELAAVDQLDTDGASVVQNDLLDLGVGDDFAARSFDDGKDSLRDSRGAAGGIRRAAEVVTRDHGMNEEATL